MLRSVSRAQALLLLVVGGLLGATAASGLVFSSQPHSASLTAQLGRLLAAPESGMPTRIVIGDPEPTAGVGPAGSSARAVQINPSTAPTAGVTVVRPSTYAYGTDDHGGHDGSGSSSGGHH